MRRLTPWLVAALCAAFPLAVRPATVEDVVPGTPFKPGDTIEFEQLDKLREYIPEPFWEHREYFFFEGMTLGIGEFHKDYAPSAERLEANEKFKGQARIGRDDSLENYTMGKPFQEVDPEDPQAGIKHAWNMDYKHDALEGFGHFFFTYWDNGDQLPLWIEGQGWGIRLSKRSDRPETNGDIFNKEKRKGAGGLSIKSPPDYRGILALGYGYKAADNPRDESREVDIWVYIPDLRRVRRISGSRRTDPVLGTDMTGEDGQGFQGIIPQYSWAYLGEAEVLAPINTRLKGYPISKDENYGPYGYSFGNDIYELRDALVIEMQPKDSDHIYKRKVLWLDKQTYQPLYAAAYDRRGELWKLMHMNHKWSERDDLHKKIEGVNSFLPAAYVLTNIRTGTGVRIEVYDAQPTRMRRGKIRKQIDIGRLSREGR